LGFVAVLLNIYGVLNPRLLRPRPSKFPRYTPVGYVLMLVSTFWFVANVSHESVADFASFKPALYALFCRRGPRACLFVRDFLPVRGLAVFSVAHLPIEWSIPAPLGGYPVAIGHHDLGLCLGGGGMWFTISPWRLRDLIDWATGDGESDSPFEAACERGSACSWCSWD